MLKVEALQEPGPGFGPRHASCRTLNDRSIRRRFRTANDTNLQTLRGIAKRADHDGHVVLQSAEIPFALSRDGVRSLAQLNPAQRLYQLTPLGRKILAG